MGLGSVPEIIESYSRLHRLGYAHSIESWYEGELVGGLYGVAIGRAFFGESMFTRMTDASKVAFVHLVALLNLWGYDLIDCQVSTAHLRRFGARDMARSEFLACLATAVDEKDHWGAGSM
jgi:leucyl/phenylalanyl-tRNA---protein transferase